MAPREMVIPEKAEIETWDSEDDAAVAKAAETFATLRSEGRLTYKTDTKGESAEQIHKFDPDAERIVATRPLQGG